MPAKKTAKKTAGDQFAPGGVVATEPSETRVGPDETFVPSLGAVNMISEDANTPCLWYRASDDAPAVLFGNDFSGNAGLGAASALETLGGGKDARAWVGLLTDDPGKPDKEVADKFTIYRG